MTTKTDTPPVKHPLAHKKQKVSEKVHVRYVLIFGIILGLGMATFAGWAVWFYHDRGVPNVTVAGRAINGKTRAQIKQVVEDQRTATRIQFIYKDKTTIATASELGISVDVDKTVQQAMQPGHSRDILGDIQIWRGQAVPLALTHDVGVLKDYIKNHFPDLIVDAKDPQLVYNPATQQFDIQPGTVGQGFDIKEFEALLPNLAAHAGIATLKVASTPVQPLIQQTTLAKLQDQVNKRIKLPLQFLYNGKVMYTADPPDIAGWIDFTPNPTDGTVTATYDKAKIQQFLTKQVGPIIAAPPVDRKVIVAGSQEIVVQAGQAGRQLQGVENLTNDVVGALTNNQALAKEVAVVEAPNRTVTLNASGDHWIEVDLSEQRATLYVGSAPVAHFAISSGVARFPTRIGEFKVWYKTPSQTMTGGSKATGDYYYLPNTTWVTYFDGQEALHTAYWHNNFGHPMSHGCINMRAADAKTVYDFAPIGTKVIVHA